MELLFELLQLKQEGNKEGFAKRIDDMTYVEAIELEQIAKVMNEIAQLRIDREKNIERIKFIYRAKWPKEEAKDE